MDSKANEQILEQIKKQFDTERTVRCSVCATEALGALNACRDCGAIYHADCWGYNGGCAVYGCTSAPRPPQPDPLRVQVLHHHRRWPRTLAAALVALSCFALGLAIGEHEATARLSDDPIDDDLPRMIEMQALPDVLLIPVPDREDAADTRSEMADELRGPEGAEPR